jgi:WD40 repeat protein
LRALPHADPTCATPTTHIGLAPSLKQMMLALAHGEVRAAGRQVASLIAPKPLYAAMRFIDLGGGGRTILDPATDAAGDRISTSGARLSVSAAAPPPTTIRDFQFALPAKFEFNTETPLTGDPGATLDVTVKVTDLGGDPVRNARVHFQAPEGSSVEPAVVDFTSVGGLATVRFTLNAAPGSNTLTVSGRGIGGSDYSGPREGVDPFQPLQTHWGDASSSDASVLVRTGSIVVNATGTTPPVTLALYSVESSTDGLSTIDLGTGARTFIGRLSPDLTKFTTPVAMATDPSDGTIYVWNNSDGSTNETQVITGVLLSVDRCTGLATQVSTAPSGIIAGSLALSPITGNLYLISGSLMRVNKTTGALTTIGPVGASVFGADFDPAGSLYAMSSDGGTLYTVNLVTGAASVVATVSPALGTVGSIVFTPSGALFVTTIDGRLFNIDKTSGAVLHEVAGGGNSQGLGFAPVCVPAP